MSNIELRLDHCTIPDERLKKSPSSEDGLNAEDEEDIRSVICERIQIAGTLLRLPQIAIATAQVLFHRFYYLKSMIRHPIEPTAMACVYLASKIEEHVRRIRDIINVFHHIRQVDEHLEINALILDQNYVNLKTQVIKAERRVLKELGFCVHVKHPHKIIVMYLKVLSYQANQSFIQIAWNYMNDSLRSDVFVRYEPEAIACACIYLTARKLQIHLPKSPVQWYEIFGVTDDMIKDICCRILKLYSKPKLNYAKLEKNIEVFRKKYQENRLSKLEAKK